MIKKIWMSFLVFMLCLVSISALSIPKQDSCIYVNDYADVISAVSYTHLLIKAELLMLKK